LRDLGERPGRISQGEAPGRKGECPGGGSAPGYEEPLKKGGGPRAFQKYESGDMLPSRAVSSALVLLDRDPDGLAVLKRRHDLNKTPVPPQAGRTPDLWKAP